ncbi:MAG: 50S ribosomal protein L29 [Gammaproteobacteria bacterium]
MKPQEIRAMSDEALGEELLKLRREQFNMRLNSATGQGTRPDQFGKIRKDIARIKTILRERVGVEVSGQSE